MAKLKVKQIGDFTTAVQNLIDNDADQNAGLIDALEASVDSLEGVTGAVTEDLEASVDSLELVASTAITERGELSASVDSLAVVDGALSDAIGDNDTDITALVASVDSIEVVDGEQNESIDSLETAISNILDIPGTDLDQFSEMVSFVQSVDTLNDGLLSDFIGVANASVDSLELVASTAITERGVLVASIDSLELVTGGATAALEASVDSLELVDGGLADDIQAVQDNLDGYALNTNASIDSLELVDAALSTEIAGNASDIGDLQASVDSLEIAEDNAIASIDSLELVDAGLAGDIAANADYVHQFGTLTTATEFTIPAAVRFGANDDLKVSVNGHVLHPIAEGFADGYATADGITFDVSAIGYPIDAEDHVYVIGIRG